MAAGSGCAAKSCPASAYGSGVHLDATAWAHGEALTATICLAGTCRPASPDQTNPDDLFLYAALPDGQAAVEVRLTTTAGRTLDVTTTAAAHQVKLEGDGCGSTPEIDLAIDSSGALVAGKARALGSPPKPRSTPTTVTPPTGLPTP